MKHYLSVKLLTDGCFSGGTRHAGEVDTDIDHEKTTGLPMIRGRILKGLLVEECAMILKALPKKPWRETAAKLFGDPGKQTGAQLSIGDGRLPEYLRRMIASAMERAGSSLSANQILRSFTDVRFQTKVNFDSGAPEPHSLRATRVALKGLVWQSPLYCTDNLAEEGKALFAACVLALRRGGLNRNRGWGKLQARIMNQDYKDMTPIWIARLGREKEDGGNG
jgi:hypothetical protein